MPENDIITIKVSGYKVGIIGLTQVMEEMSESCAQKDEAEIQAELLARLRRKNYIPDKAKDDYGSAFLREFKKFLGQPFEEVESPVMEIRVLGPGCMQCDKLEMEIRGVMTDLNLAADLEHITDIKEIGRYGIMGTPALVINGKVKAVGRVPPRNQIRGWLEEETLS